MLTKLAEAVFVPGVTGQPALPQRVVCTSAPSQPAGGSWQTVCTATQIFVGWNNGPATFDNPGPFPKPVYVDTGIVCRTQWVPAPVRPQPPPPQQCYTIPAQPFIPSSPPRIDSVPVFAWNAGANSVVERAGNVRLAFTMGEVLGVIVGLTQDREAVGSPDRMSHGFVFTMSANGRPMAQVREGARVVTAAEVYVPGETLFEVLRTGSTVLYRRDGAVIYTSRRPSDGIVSVGCAIYATGDRVL